MSFALAFMAAMGLGWCWCAVRLRLDGGSGSDCAVAGMRKAPFTPCKLFYDGGAALEVGDYLKTPGGSAYLIQKVRQNRNRAYRRHLECVRWPIDEIPDNAVVHSLHWYRREKKRGRTLAELRA